jgi:hypothetical protein
MPAYGILRRVSLVRTDFSEEHPFLQEPRGVTSQKTAFFMIIAMETSNLTFFILITEPDTVFVANPNLAYVYCRI